MESLTGSASRKDLAFLGLDVGAASLVLVLIDAEENILDAMPTTGW